MNQRQDPIGVFDSGIGGISALQAMVRLMPRETFIYYGDSLNAPYGTKTPEEVRSCVRAVVNRLLDQQVKALVIACNTATSAAAETLRRELEIPVIGMEPALKPAHEIRHGGKILVLATPLTLRQPKFSALMDRYGEGAVRVPCEGLMELVEREDMDGARSYLEKLFSRFDLRWVDAVVLGCTHYVFLKSMIREMLPDHIAITEGSEGTARQLERVLKAAGLNREEGDGHVIFETSGPAEEIATMERFLSRRL